MANSYEEIANLTNRITELVKGIDIIAKNISKIKIDIQDKLSANKLITSGTSATVSYDSKGLIIGSDKLKAEDIPEISIDQIKDLRHVLGSKVDNSDFARTIENIKNNMIKHSDTIAHTGTKVSYDKNGMIISSTREESIFWKAPPMITPTAMSRTFPRAMNCLNSSIIRIPPLKLFTFLL
jgi:hypothetical protein